MKKLKIFDLFGSIQSIELKRFIRYIKSDSVFASRDYYPLTGYLLKYYPDFNNKEISLEGMYKSLYPGKAYNKRVIISRLSELNRITENFLISLRINKDNSLRGKILAEELILRKINDPFEQLMKKLINEEKNVKKISERQLYELDSLMMIKGQYLVDREKFIETHDLLEENITIFLIYVITRLLTMYCAIRNIENFQVAGTSIKLLESYMKNINLENLVKSLSGSRLSAYMKVMVQIYKLYGKKSNDKVYFKAKKEFLNSISNFEQISKFTIFSFLYSYTVQQINMRRLEFNKEIYELLKLIIKYNGYMKAGNEYMPSMLYREFVITALKQKDIAGAEKFIENYKDTLAPEFRTTIYQYSMGKIKMHTRNFTAALKLYDSCPQNIQIINLDMRIDRLAALYELGYLDRFAAELKKNKSLLVSNKNITVFQRSSFKSYNGIMEKLLNLRLKPELKLKNKLIAEINSVKVLHYKEWMIKQLNNL